MTDIPSLQGVTPPPLSYPLDLSYPLISGTIFGAIYRRIYCTIYGTINLTIHHYGFHNSGAGDSIMLHGEIYGSI